MVANGHRIRNGNEASSRQLSSGPQSMWRRIKGAGKGILYGTRMRVWWSFYQRWHRIRKWLEILPPAAERRIVIGIGMHRTGTRSLAKYLQTLGFKDLHWPWWCERQVSKHLNDPNRAAEILEPLLYYYDCFSDVPFPGLYRVLDRQFPNSRFILVRRDARQWWRSVCRHWELEKRAYRLDPFEELVYRQYDPSDMVVVTKDDGSVLMEKYLRHCEEAQTFFRDRPDKLLVVDLEDENLNVRISTFLGAASRPYPRERSDEWQ